MQDVRDVEPKQILVIQWVRWGRHGRLHLLDEKTAHSQNAWGPLIFTPLRSGPKPFPKRNLSPGAFRLDSPFFVDRKAFEFFAMLLLAPAEANLATCAPREPPATGRCCYDFPAPSALQGCFLNLPTEAFDEAFSSSGLLTTEPCATVTTMPLPHAATGCEAQAMEEHAAEDIKHFGPTTVRLPAARSLPLGLADGGHAALRGRAGR